MWLRRDEDDAAAKRCKAEFNVSCVRSTHEAVDANTAREMHGLNSLTINFGAHPNQLGLLLGVDKTKEGRTTTFLAPILKVDGPSIVLALQTAVKVGIGALKTVALIYPERFLLMSIDSQLQAFVDELDSVLNKMGKLTRVVPRSRRPTRAVSLLAQVLLKNLSEHERLLVGLQ